eukprot:m.337688 g.337688  ORF g.337688 m.337688 type:complete len:277 (-) comp18208_c0_seq1:228-1058(-)
MNSHKSPERGNHNASSLLGSPNAMKTEFSIDDGFVDVDTLLGMDGNWCTDSDTLLGSVYSPFRFENLPTATHALDKMVANGARTHVSPKHFVPMSPSPDRGHYRRSARLTPSRLLRSPFAASPFKPNNKSATTGDDGFLFKCPSLNLESHENSAIASLGMQIDNTVLNSANRINNAGSMHKNSRSMKKEKKRRERQDKRTMSAPKRGEYKCGKCGFFPKKTKHNCDEERSKRMQPDGTIPDDMQPMKDNRGEPMHTNLDEDPDQIMSFVRDALSWQ